MARTVYAFDAHDGAPVGSFPSIAAAGRALNINYNQVMGCLAGEHRHAHGYVFSYDGECPPLPSRVGRFWTIERCLEEAKKYRTRTEFMKKSPGAYKAFQQSGRFSECCIEPAIKPNGWWTIERSLDEAKKYRTRVEFQKGAHQAYNVVREAGRLDECGFVEIKKPNRYWTVERSLKEAEKYRTISDFVKYAPGAYNVLHDSGNLFRCVFDEKIKPKGWWTIERCLEEARKYRTRKEFMKKSSSAYTVLWKAGRLDECGFVELNKPKGYYTREKCFELSREFTTSSEFRKKWPTAYRVSRDNNWLDEMTWLAPSTGFEGRGWRLYTYEFQDGCVYVGITVNPHKRAASHRGEYGRKDSAVYKHHLESGLPVPEMVIRLEGLTAEDAQRKEREFVDMYRRDSDKTVLNVARPGGLGGVARKWTWNRIEAEARKFKTLREFREKCRNAYSAAYKRGLQGKLDFLEKEHRGWWTRESLVEHVRAMGCRTLKEFRKGDDSAYQVSCRMGLTAEELGLERDARKPGFWTVENALKTANENKDMTRGEFMHRYYQAWRVLNKNRLLDEVGFRSAKMRPEIRAKMSRKVLQYSLDGTFMAEYPSFTEAAIKTNSHDSGISMCCSGRQKTHNGFVWRLAAEPQAEEPPADKPR